MNKWSGYIHQDGSLHAKRYSDHKDLDDAHESDFVAKVVSPFDCDSREEALEHIGKFA